ncbi:hypothetical protein [Micromonospora sp. NPDC002717]
MPVTGQPVDAVERVLGDLPVPWYVTTEDLKLAIRVAHGGRVVRVPDGKR